MRARVKNFVDACQFCKKMSRLSPTLRVQPFTFATYRFAERFDIDTVGLLPKDDLGYEYVLVVRLHPMRDASVLEGARAMIDNIGTLACLRVIHLDQGVQFVGELFDLMAAFGFGTLISITRANSKEESAMSRLTKKLTDTCAR
jgi:hypothetical protein